MIELKGVSKLYGENSFYAVKSVDLTINDNEFLAIVGASGSGKTTLLKTINRLIEPSAGEVFFDGENILHRDVVQHRRNIGYIFQKIGLFPHLTIQENMSIVPRLLGRDEASIQKRLPELFDLIELEQTEYADRFPSQLSGGQQQRIGVARALAANPKVVLMDEPFGALDPVTRAAIQKSYKKIHQKLSLTSIMVTHDMSEALFLADRIAVMSEGEILEIGTPEEMVNTPKHPYVIALMDEPLRQGNFLQSLKEGHQS